jgi:hypothetical protein
MTSPGPAKPPVRRDSAMAILARTDSTKDAFERAWKNGAQYVTRVNRGGLDVERHTDYLNEAFRSGFALHSIFEQNGNTVMVFERRAA